MIARARDGVASSAELGELVNSGVLKQALKPTGIAALFQAVPQLYQVELWIAAAHIPDYLQLSFYVLVRMEAKTP